MFDTDHAVVIIGIEQTHVLLADPGFDDALYQVPVEYFLTAWSERDFEYALIGLSDT